MGRPVQTPVHPDIFRTVWFFVVSGQVLTWEIRSPCLRKASCDMTVALNDPLTWDPLCRLTDETCSLPGFCLFWHVKPIPYQESCLSVLTCETPSLPGVGLSVLTRETLSYQEIVLTCETHSLPRICSDTWNPFLTRNLSVLTHETHSLPGICLFWHVKHLLYQESVCLFWQSKQSSSARHVEGVSVERKERVFQPHQHGAVRGAQDQPHLPAQDLPQQER